MCVKQLSFPPAGPTRRGTKRDGDPVGWQRRRRHRGRFFRGACEPVIKFDLEPLSFQQVRRLNGLQTVGKMIRLKTVATSATTYRGEISGGWSDHDPALASRIAGHFGQEPTIPLDMALDNKSKGVRHGL